MRRDWTAEQIDGVIYQNSIRIFGKHCYHNPNLK